MLVISRGLDESVALTHKVSGVRFLVTLCDLIAREAAVFHVVNTEGKRFNMSRQVVEYGEGFMIRELNAFIKLQRKASDREVVIGIDAPTNVNIVRTEIETKREQNKG